MRIKKVGTITLALGLIILGLALFANNFTSIEIKDIYKYWPVLLIGIGLEMFIFNIIYKHEENVKLRIDGLCIALIVVAFIFANNTGFFNFSPKFSFNPFQGNVIIDGVKYKSELRETIVKDNISSDTKVEKLTVRNSFGDIKLQDYDQPYIKVEAHITVKYNDENAAKEYIKNAFKITEGQSTEVYTLDYNGINKDKYAKAQIDYVIYVPKGVKVDVHNSFGDISAQNLAEALTIANQHGDVAAFNIGGSVTMKNSFGHIEAKDIGGRLDADNQHGDIDVENVAGNADVETGFGELEINNVAGQLIARNNYGRIMAKGIKGDAQIKTSFGDIEVSDIEGNTTINDNNGKIEAEDIKGNVEIRNSFGKISFSSPNLNNADIYAKTSFGSIKTDLPISITKAINDQTAAGKTGEGKYKVELVTNNGEIEID